MKRNFEIKIKLNISVISDGYASTADNLRFFNSLFFD